MWIRKSHLILQKERRQRLKRFELVVISALGAILIGLHLYFGSLDNLILHYKQNPEQTVTLLLVPLLIYMSYRNYVIHGSIHERPGKICLTCGNGLGYSDDGWGFKVHGKKKKEWYQVHGCKTPDKCEIIYQFEAEWVNDNDV